VLGEISQRREVMHHNVIWATVRAQDVAVHAQDDADTFPYDQRIAAATRVSVACDEDLERWPMWSRRGQCATT
jgi:hypothetical protein